MTFVLRQVLAFGGGTLGSTTWRALRGRNNLNNQLTAHVFQSVGATFHMWWLVVGYGGKCGCAVIETLRQGKMTESSGVQLSEKDQFANAAVIQMHSPLRIRGGDGW